MTSKLPAQHHDQQPGVESEMRPRPDSTPRDGAGLVERGIRVNAVAPGPIWTPLIPSTFSADEVASFGQECP